MIKVVDGRGQTTAGHAATVKDIRAWSRPLSLGERVGVREGESARNANIGWRASTGRHIPREISA